MTKHFTLVDVVNMVFRPESFKQLEKIIVQSFSGQTKVQLRSNCDNVIINIIII